jgi:formylglycine-generating enzyme required for sulfatase activity
MVGNVWEWVADWVPPFSGSCGTALFGSGDLNCLAGSAQAAGTAALVRGGFYIIGTNAGVFDVNGFDPSSAVINIGFRCAR